MNIPKWLLMFFSVYRLMNEANLACRISNLAMVALFSSGEVFGEFRNADGSGLEWGVVDYATKTRTTIAQAANAYVALGIAQDGYAYGVAQDGNLYRIDRKTGGETSIVKKAIVK